MWHDIFITNKRAIAPLLDKSIDILQNMKNDLEQDNLESAFTRASTTRNKIPLHNKGFISQLFEILVVAQDRAGVIASLSTTLADQSINIKDIEVMKIREGEGGTIKLAFESKKIAQKAITILQKHGFSAWERA
jgi:prephenate dehydrogenase